MTLQRLCLTLIGLALLFGILLVPVRAQDAIAHAVLFYSPTCPHCHVVLTEVLPPLQTRYADRLQILTIDVSTPDGLALYETAMKVFQVPTHRQGVPALFFGQTHLVGSVEIPRYLPTLVEDTLAAGGNGWPAIPGLEALTASFDDHATVPTQPATAPFSRDPLANTVALFVLTGMVIVTFIAIRRLRWPFDQTLPVTSVRFIPILAVVGLVLAGYLAFIETRQQSAVCGPIGDCNLVHQSPYARIVGIPVGVLGVIGYLAILGAWIIDRVGSIRLARQTLVIMVVGGTFFSLYLTFLEPFVIGATCLWCLLSAITMTALLWMVTAPVVQPPMRGRRSLAASRR